MGEPDAGAEDTGSNKVKNEDGGLVPHRRLENLSIASEARSLDNKTAEIGPASDVEDQPVDPKTKTGDNTLRDDHAPATKTSEPDQESTCGDQDLDRGINPENQQQEQPNNDDDATEDKNVTISVGTEKKKKKKKSKSKMSKGAKKPTGFEEYYVDPPVTPAEFMEEKGLYDPSRSIEERIETAIQRYSARRKFGEMQREMFDKWLNFGGIESGPNMFGGGTDPGAEELDAADIAQLKATKYIAKFVMDGEAVFDIDGVLRAFLSSHLAHFCIDDEATIKFRVHVMRNFFNYLLHHDVCPEYAHQVHAAKATCNLAESEIWRVNQSSRLFPGAFNEACSMLFGGFHSDSYVGDNPWMIDHPNLDPGMDRARATKIFQGALAAHASDATCELYNQQVQAGTARQTAGFTTWLEVIAIEPAGAEIQALYAHPSMLGCRTLGRMRARKWLDPKAPPIDMSEGEEEEIELKKEADRLAGIVEVLPEWDFWLESDGPASLLACLFVGMKFEARVYELSFGVSFFDSVSSVRCSFWLWIANVDMMGWKPHVPLPYRESYPAPEIVVVGDGKGMGTGIVGGGGGGEGGGEGGGGGREGEVDDDMD